MSQNQNLNVLVAEDDALINEGIANQLSRLGYASAGQAYNGVEAVEMASARRPGLVLMDLQMIDPETGREDAEAGLKAASAIQQRCPTAVVVLSAYESPDLIRQSAEAGVSGYLVKPAADQDLSRMLTIARARFNDLMELRLLADELARQAEDMRRALARAKALSGLLVICAWCKKIQAEQGFWRELSAYVEEHAEVSFTHGICPECLARVVPDSPRQRGLPKLKGPPH